MLSTGDKIKIGDKKKYLIFSELHSLLSSGISFSRSFDLLIQSEKKQKEIHLFKGVYDRMLGGAEFWKSMESSGAFTDLDCGVIRIGEETGKLDQSLLFLSDYYRKKNEQKRMLTSALSYPIIIVITALLVLFFMMTVVVPMFEQVYSRMGGSLPGITTFMINASSKFPALILIIGVFVISLTGIKFFYGKTERYKRIHSSFILSIPLAGNLIRIHYRAQFCKLLYLLISSEVPLLRSLNMLESIISFYPYSKSFNSVAEGLKRGESFSDNLANFNDLYGNKLLTLIRVGEETNCLDRMLLNQSNDITAELEHNLKQLSNILEPILILCIGVIVAFVLIAMYMPMFMLGQTIG